MRARGLTLSLLCSLAILTVAPAALATRTSLYSGKGIARTTYPAPMSGFVTLRHQR